MAGGVSMAMAAVDAVTLMCLWLALPLLVTYITDQQLVLMLFKCNKQFQGGSTIAGRSHTFTRKNEI